jgi:hypothetical protein
LYLAGLVERTGLNFLKVAQMTPHFELRSRDLLITSAASVIGDHAPSQRKPLPARLFISTLAMKSLAFLLTFCAFLGLVASASFGQQTIFNELEEPNIPDNLKLCGDNNDLLV